MFTPRHTARYRNTDGSDTSNADLKKREREREKNGGGWSPPFLSHTQSINRREIENLGIDAGDLFATAAARRETVRATLSGGRVARHNLSINQAHHPYSLRPLSCRLCLFPILFRFVCCYLDSRRC